MPNSTNSSKPPHDSQSTPGMGEPPTKRPSRLANLRGKVTAAILRELKRENRQESGPETSEKYGGEEDKVEAVPAELIEALREVPEEIPGRLSGLRGLVTLAELQGLQPAKGSLHATAEPRDRQEGEVQGAHDDGDSTTDAAPMDRNEEAGRTGRITTKKSDSMTESDVAPLKPRESVVRDRRVEVEEVQTLPSKRGQYRQKK